MEIKGTVVKRMRSAKGPERAGRLQADAAIAMACLILP